MGERSTGAQRCRRRRSTAVNPVAVAVAADPSLAECSVSLRLLRGAHHQKSKRHSSTSRYRRPHSACLPAPYFHGAPTPRQPLPVDRMLGLVGVPARAARRRQQLRQAAQCWVGQGRGCGGSSGLAAEHACSLHACRRSPGGACACPHLAGWRLWHGSPPSPAGPSHGAAPLASRPWLGVARGLWAGKVGGQA